MNLNETVIRDVHKQVHVLSNGLKINGTGALINSLVLTAALIETSLPVKHIIT